LTARGLGASTGGAIAALLPAVPLLAEDDRNFGHWQITRRAMACDFTIYLPPLVQEPLALAKAAFDEIDLLEDLLTVYHDDSEMSRVNQHASQRPVRTDARLFSLLQRAAELTRQTDGAFDVAAGAMVKAWGFFKGPRRVPDADEHAAALRCCGMNHVELAEPDLTVRYDVAGLEINLGSIGKGYAIDHAVRRMRQDFGLGCGLITGGTSSLFGLGSPNNDDRGWMIGIEDPCDPAQYVATVRLKDRALGTSSGSNQYFEVDGKVYSHLLDPRTGWPADQVASASALAADAATADALATAFFIMGLDKTAEFCQNHPDIAAIIVLDDNAVNRPSGKATPPTNRQNPRVVTFNLRATDVKIGPGQASPRPQEG
jgi:thiamine biosynthesis lipoprotein